jgi:hypothetical protein
MATNLITSIVDLIGGHSSLEIINDIKGTKIWSAAKCVSAEIESESAVTDNPIMPLDTTDPDTNTKLMQQDELTLKIIRPSRVRLSLIAPDLSTLESIINDFNDVQLTVSITTKSVIIQSLCILEVGIEQTPQMLSAARVNITLEQAVLPTVIGGFFPANSSDMSVYGVQFQTPAPISQTVSGLYNNISSRILSVL